MHDHYETCNYANHTEVDVYIFLDSTHSGCSRSVCLLEWALQIGPPGWSFSCNQYQIMLLEIPACVGRNSISTNITNVSKLSIN